MEHHIDELVSAYIDNELSVEDLQMVRQHLESCEQCNQLVEELLHIQSGVMGIFQNIQAPIEVGDKILGQINSKSTEKTGLLALGFLMILIVAAIYLFGSVIFKTISIITKILMGIIYTCTQFMGDQPTIIIGVILFAIILLVISGVALRRLLQFNNTEGDESFG